MLFWIFDVGVVSFCPLQKIHMKSFELFSKQLGNADKSCVGKLFIKCYIFKYLFLKIFTVKTNRPDSRFFSQTTLSYFTNLFPANFFLQKQKWGISLFPAL